MFRTYTATLVRILFIVPLLATGIALSVPGPASAATLCTQDSPFANGGTVRDNLVVSAGSRCILIGTVVRGGITVEPGGDLTIRDGAEIRGAITAVSPRRIAIVGAVVRGGITVTGGAGDTGPIGILGVEVRGSVVASGNTGSDDIQILGSAVRGNVVIVNNVTTTRFDVINSAIDGNLECSGNVAPFFVDGNVIGGSATGQCQVTEN